ncbi:Negative elongation factor E [Frankliniella fusca]|uniref:Negative elongation factor E n=1 Tax=Frankliniella fusca TaxID=407009 RepID=A0AAE1H2N2_9NEOP|nr:Negative elongation factor E [Frankliniella fusca]
MVYLHFPTNLTEEELMLQTKYQKLKKKKKALQAWKAPKPEPERTTPTQKRPTEGRDAREVARKLLKSGAIPAIPKIQKRPEQAGFKRPRGLERKLSAAERTVSAYQPFQPAHADEVPAAPADPPEKPRVKNLYDSFVTAREKDAGDKDKEKKPEKPRAGNTIFVQGYSITEDLLRKAFMNCGTIINVSMEVEKDRGFVTFKTEEAAERAISEINGSKVSGIQLKVSLARRQPQISPISDTPSSSSGQWSAIAASHSQKGSHKDKRQPVVYEEEDMFS